MGLLDRIMGTGNPTPNTGIVHNGNGSTQGAGPAPQPQPNPNDKIPQNNPGADPKNLPANGGAGDGKTQEAISPLDGYKDIWKTTDASGKPIVDPLSQPLLQNDPVKFAEAAKKLNFAANLSPEAIQKALGGDAQAFTDIINNVAQSAFMASTTLNNQMVETASRTNNDRLNSVMEKKFQEFLVGQQRSDNPVLQHAAAAPMLDLAKRQLLQQHPDKSAAEIHQMAEGYLTSFGEQLMGHKEKQTTGRSTVVDNQDFSGWTP